MNNNTLKDLFNKVFYSGNPMFLYIGINVILFVLTAIGSLAFKNVDLLAYVGIPSSITLLPNRFYSIVTYMFFNVEFLNFLFNMLWLFWFGSIFMNFLKTKQFHFVYLGGGLIAALFYIVTNAILPTLGLATSGGYLIGSASVVLAIVVASATLVPNYAIKMIIFGEIKIMYIALVFVALDVIALIKIDLASVVAHLAAALFGFIFIKQLQSGNDWSKLFDKKPTLKVVKNTNPVKNTSNPIKKSPMGSVPQVEIDAILDKISSSGYDQLSALEKEKLFKASNN
ncbi:rhomboid family intramembrane serine protease [Pedobacter changchengzhani]|uniref:Rhomboid family intramembrane serine protease n=1 Tax=Pedobacter changchengzhani TaxID=2529274 RepID=A0A4R5MJF7_9SPHI|nr:rhomboid family intramembrane serine protease [Pedobacter changchengzhani]TDG35209.1 rhomboid family intramembrane serine protease [Pedobacter changchengzhani]